MLKELVRGDTLVISAALVAALACSDRSPSATADEKRSSAGEKIVAQVEGESITLGQVDERALTTNMTAYQELYNARREVLEQLIADVLLNQEAVVRGIAKDDLVAQEITSKAKPITGADVEDFFRVNKSRLGGQPLEQIAPQIQQFLEGQQTNIVRQTFLEELRKKFDVDIILDPPRIPMVIASNEPTKGSPDADVTIVEYSDFQ